MTSGSLRLRLLLLAVAGIGATLLLAGIGLTALFERHVERRVGAELDTHIAQIAGSLRVDPARGLILARQPADPRFGRVYGGLYWQVTDESDGRLLRSHSLWDADLTLPADTPPIGDVHVHRALGPDGEPVILHERRLVLAGATGEVPVRIAVAINLAEVDTLKTDFARELLPGLGLLGILLLGGLWLQVGAGLAPLTALQQAIRQVRAGRVSRLSRAVPAEVLPLVEEVNSLLESQESALRRGRDRAADLAHGLKTPLTALAADVRRLRRAGEHAVANDIEAVAQQMQRHIERELARSRLRHRHGPRPASRLRPAVLAIVDTVARTPAGESRAFDVRVADDTTVGLDMDDLNDVLGNLVENAARHAASTVRIAACPVGPGIRVQVEDDGRGVAAADLPQLFERGRRLDQRGGSAGLGLSIVNDILGEYSIVPGAGASELGGLAISFTCPAGGGETPGASAPHGPSIGQVSDRR